MSINRHLSRTVAMQTLYEWDFRNNQSLQDIIRRNIDIYKDDVDPNYVIHIVEGVKSKLNEIDQRIVEVAPEFPIEQIASIDKAIIRLAIFEIIYDNDVPAKVAINEAVELGKNFGNDNSYKFINGVLGTIYRRAPGIDPSTDNVDPFNDSKVVKDNNE